MSYAYWVNPVQLVWHDDKNLTQAVGATLSASSWVSNAWESSSFSGYQPGAGALIDHTLQYPDGVSSSAFAQAAVGTSYLFASSNGHEVSNHYGGGTATVASVWRDTFSVDAYGMVTLRLQAGKAPLALEKASAPSAVLYNFGVFRVNDGKDMAQLFFHDSSGQSNIVGSAMSVNSAGVYAGVMNLNPDLNAQRYGLQMLDLTLTPYLEAGNYEILSQLKIDSWTTMSAGSAIGYTASLTSITVSDSVKLTSSSGLLAETAVPGTYGYAVSSVPEPSHWMMVLAGLGIMGSVVRRHHRAVGG